MKIDISFLVDTIDITSICIWRHRVYELELVHDKTECIRSVKSYLTSSGSSSLSQDKLHQWAICGDLTEEEKEFKIWCQTLNWDFWQPNDE